MTAHRYYVQAIEAHMHEASTGGDLPDGRFLAGDTVVRLVNRGGEIRVPWSGDLPKIGDEITVDVDGAA